MTWFDFVDDDDDNQNHKYVGLGDEKIAIQQ